VIGGRVMMKMIDIASYFLSRESMSPRKLQLLCYYAQAWSLKKLNKRITNDNFEAWLNGPTNPALYKMFKEYDGNQIPMKQFNYEALAPEHLNILEHVYLYYHNLSDDELLYISKNEEPWRRTRKNTTPWQTSLQVISDENMMLINLDAIDVILSTRGINSVSFGFKLWDFSVGNTDEALGFGEWFQEILAAMSMVTGKSKNELRNSGILLENKNSLKRLNQLGFTINKENSDQYDIEEIHLTSKKCSLFGVFIESIFHIIWFVSEQVKTPVIETDERVNMALEIEKIRKNKIKIFELERENLDLQNRNKELWELLDEMTDPKIKMYKQ